VQAGGERFDLLCLVTEPYVPAARRRPVVQRKRIACIRAEATAASYPNAIDTKPRAIGA
jgi:hypothetical protein